MAIPTRILIALVLSAMSLLPIGCSKKEAESDPETLRIKGELYDIYDMYTMFTKNNGRPPKQASDLLAKNAEIVHPEGVRALKSGGYVVVWGVSGNDSGTVLAYQKDAPKQGGWVIMADGKPPQQMSADELKGKI
jgi:hypothetical protein